MDIVVRYLDRKSMVVLSMTCKKYNVFLSPRLSIIKSNNYDLKSAYTNMRRFVLSNKMYGVLCDKDLGFYGNPNMYFVMEEPMSRYIKGLKSIKFDNLYLCLRENFSICLCMSVSKILGKQHHIHSKLFDVIMDRVRMHKPIAMRKSSKTQSMLFKQKARDCWKYYKPTNTSPKPNSKDLAMFVVSIIFGDNDSVSRFSNNEHVCKHLGISMEDISKIIHTWM